MTEPHSSLLDVPGARLYYETYGDGPLLVMIPGAAGSAEPYRMLAAELAPDLRLVAYDRRGFSRSVLVGEQDYARRLDTDADDVAALLAQLSDAPAQIFSNSSGALVALRVLTRHPSAVDRVIAHEPPAMTELADGRSWLEFFSSLFDSYQQSGPGAAMDRFRERSFPESDRQLVAHAPTTEFSEANSRYWFEHELRQYPATRLDHETLQQHSDRLVLAVGSDSRGYPCHEATSALGRDLGRQPVELPGGHVGFISHAAAFARALEPYLDSPAEL